MKRKGNIETIKAIESLVKQRCDYVIAKDASINGGNSLGVYTKVYIIHSRQCLIVLRLMFESRDNIGRIEISNEQLYILCQIVPELRNKLGELQQWFSEQGGKNGLTSNSSNLGNNRYLDSTFKSQAIP